MMSRTVPRARRARKRLERRERRAKLGSAPLVLDPPKLAIEDPLAEKRQRFLAGKILGVAVVALVLHGAGLVVIFFAAKLAALVGLNFTNDAGKIEVAVVETKPKPPPEPEPPKEEPKPPEPEPPPPPKKKIKPPPPPPDPVDVPPEPPPEPPKEQPEAVVGLSADSAVTEGDGPSFAVGNTRMGETDKTAVDPSKIGELTKTGVIPPPPPPPAPKVPVVKPPRPKKNPDQLVEYPTRYRQMGLEGDVTVEITVGPDGEVLDVVVTKESEHPEFNFAAKKAARRLEFEPATRDGVPIQYKLTRVFRFRLEG